MTTEWDNEEILKFVELYQAEPTIWDPSHRQHKDKKKVNDAWIRLSELMNRPVRVLKKKKESLMATFRGYLRKKKASIQCGATGDDIYKPIWFAYDLMEQFLAPWFECNPSLNTEQTLPIDEVLVETTYDETDDLSDFDPNPNQQPHSNSNASTVTESTAPAVSQRPLKRQKPPIGLREVEMKMKEAFSMLKDVVEQGQQKEDDDCDLYGKILAIKMRKLNDIGRQVLMHRIDGMVIDALVQQNISPLHQTTATAGKCFKNAPNQSTYSDNEHHRSASSRVSTYSDNQFLRTTLLEHSNVHQPQYSDTQDHRENQKGSDNKSLASLTLGPYEDSADNSER